MISIDKILDSVRQTLASEGYDDLKEAEIEQTVLEQKVVEIFVLHLRVQPDLESLAEVRVPEGGIDAAELIETFAKVAYVPRGFGGHPEDFCQEDRDLNHGGAYPLTWEQGEITHLGQVTLWPDADIGLVVYRDSVWSFDVKRNSHYDRVGIVTLRDDRAQPWPRDARKRVLMWKNAIGRSDSACQTLISTLADKLERALAR